MAKSMGLYIGVEPDTFSVSVGRRIVNHLVSMDKKIEEGP